MSLTVCSVVSRCHQQVTWLTAGIAPLMTDCITSNQMRNRQLLTLAVLVGKRLSDRGMLPAVRFRPQ